MSHGCTTGIGGARGAIVPPSFLDQILKKLIALLIFSILCWACIMYVITSSNIIFKLHVREIQAVQL